MSKKLAGKVALVTGGSSGIGLATAQLYAAEGATVFITGRRREELDAAVKLIGPQAVGVQGDVAKLADLDKLFDIIKTKAGKLDIVFANAGSGEFVKLGDITEAHFDKYFGINVKGVLFTVQKALPLMPDGAAIVLNASIVATKGLPAFSVYSATKAAVRNFARSFSVDLKDRHIRVNVVSPGVVVTPAYKKELGMTEEQIKGFVDQAVATIPLGRTGTAEEIAKAVLFLSSDDSSWITGIELFVDGGMAQI